MCIDARVDGRNSLPQKTMIYGTASTLPVARKCRHLHFRSSPVGGELGALLMDSRRHYLLTMKVLHDERGTCRRTTYRPLGENAAARQGENAGSAFAFY